MSVNILSISEELDVSRLLTVGSNRDEDGDVIFESKDSLLREIAFHQDQVAELVLQQDQQEAVVRRAICERNDCILEFKERVTPLAKAVDKSLSRKRAIVERQRRANQKLGELQDQLLLLGGPL